MSRWSWKNGMAAGVFVFAAGVAGAASVEERLAALEAKFELEASAREAVLLERIGVLEGQVVALSRQVADATVPVSGQVADQNVLTRMTTLETQLASLEADQMSNPLKDIQIGGYGELHYNGLSGSGGASDKREVDFHRFVLMIGKDFNERVRLRTEFELEHALAGEGKSGEVELEQAYIDFDLNDRHTARAGLFLMPIGLLNETHEPTRFYGVERNPVENNIIPTTWWEAGAGMHGMLTESLSYDAYLHSVLKTSADKKYAVRSGRQKVANANASDPAATVALNWSIPGVTLGGSAQYQVDVTQGQSGDAEPVRALFGEVHADLQKGQWGLRMLYAQWNLDGDGPRAVGADRQYGWFIEPSYKINESLGVFARYNQWNNQAGGSGQTGKEQVDVGVNWWPHEQVVVKADYQWQMNDDGKNQNGINLGVGYDF